MFFGESYDTFYTDENAYRFTRDREYARPMGVNQGVAIVGFAQDRPFRDTLKFEEEPYLRFAMWVVADEPDADYWFWDRLFGGYVDQLKVPLAIPNPAPAGTAQLRVRLRGSTDLEPGDEHHVYAQLNGVQVGTMLNWDGFSEAILVADFGQELLEADGDNVLVLRNSYTPGEHPQQRLDDIEIDYDRLPVANSAGMVRLHDVDAGAQLVSGFGTDDLPAVRKARGRESGGGGS